MSAPPAPAKDVASAVAQAIGAILRAMLDALFGDVSGLAPRHPIRRSYERACADIERYTEALAAALTPPAEADAPHPDSVRTPAPALRRARTVTPYLVASATPPDLARAPPPKNARFAYRERTPNSLRFSN